MKALALPHAGSHQFLKPEEFPVPDPGRNEVRVRMAAAGLNPADYKLMLSGHPARQYPYIPGLDGAGIIDAVGEGVDERWRPGDRVAFHHDLRRNGTFAEYVVVAEVALARIPDAVSDEEAASLPCSGLTAFHGLHKLGLSPGDTLLLLGGAGGVGSLAIQLARQQQLRLLATASGKNQSYLTELGVDYPLDYTQQDVPAEVQKITGNVGVNGVFDTVGSSANPALFSYPAYSGKVVSIVDVPPLPKTFFGRALSFHSFMLGTVYAYGSRTQQAFLLGESLEQLLRQVEQKQLTPQIGKIISCRNIPAGLDLLKAGHVTGKIVARMDFSAAYRD